MCWWGERGQPDKQTQTDGPTPTQGAPGRLRTACSSHVAPSSCTFRQRPAVVAAGEVGSERYGSQGSLGGGPGRAGVREGVRKGG